MADDDGESKLEGFKWTTSATYLLLSLLRENYRELQTGVKKCVFRDIANEINAQSGTELTFEQIDSKWKGLKRTYYKMKGPNWSKRKSKKNWEFYGEVDDILHHALEMNSMATVSSEDIYVTSCETELDLVDYSEEATSSTYKPKSNRIHSIREEIEFENKSEGFKWSKDTTLLLISLIRDNYDHLQTGVKKSVFREIAKEINAKTGTNLSFEQIDTKWKGLKRTYEKMRESHLETGQCRQNWEFYDDVDEILQSATQTNALATASSDEIVDTGCETDFDFVDYREEAIPSTYEQNPQKRRNRLQEMEAARERRHQEKMEIARKFLVLFEKMVDKM